MRRPLRGLAWIGAVLAISAAPPQSRAQENRYWLMSANDAIASIGDFAGRIRNGDVVRFDIVLLRRQPVRVGDIDAYWAEGLQEIDCVKHSTRVTLTAGLSLDRSRRVAQPPTQQRDWGPILPNTSMKTIEDFACRGVVRPPIRAVDLTSFQREFVPDGPLAATAPATPAAPAPARPAALPPLPAAPGTSYYVVTRTNKHAMLLRRDSIVRKGNIATVAVLRLGVSPEKVGASDDYWTESTWQFDCVKHSSQLTAHAMLPLDRSVRHPLTGPQSSDWGPYEDESEAADMAQLACNGAPASRAWQITDLTAFQRSFFATANAPYPPPIGPAMTAISPRFVVTGYAKDSASIADRGRMRRTGTIVQIPTYSLLTKADRIRGVDAYWLDASEEFDCARHRQRVKLVGAAVLDRKSGASEPDRPFDDWEPVTEDLDKAIEALMCNGQMGPFMSGGDDLFAIQRSFFAYARSSDELFEMPARAAAPPAAGPPRPAAPAPTARATKFEPYYIMAIDNEDADLVDRATAKRAGDIVTATEIILDYAPVKGGGLADKYWEDYTVQHDCAQHRSRMMLRSFRTLDRKRSSDVPNPSYERWIANDPKTLAAEVEALLCRDVTTDLPTTGDLAEFQDEYFTFVKGRLGK